jgi:two-component system NtrC family sensor kinase
MRIATRLILAIACTIAAVIVVYGLITQRQREALLRDALERETKTLAHTLQIVANNAIRDGRFADLNRVLGEVIQDPATFVSAVFDAQGRALAGGGDQDFGCLRSSLAVRPPTEEQAGWADCGGLVRWVALPAVAPAASVVLARRGTVIEEFIATSRLRHLLLGLILTAAAGIAILHVLRRTLTEPLAEIMRGVRSLGGSEAPELVPVPRSAGELGDLALAFNDMVVELQRKQDSMLKLTEQRVATQRKLRQAEKFAVAGRLTSGLAHELGSPLSTIRVRAEAILADSTIAAGSRRQAEQIIEEADRIAELVRGLLLIVRRDGLERQPLDLAEVVRLVANEREHTAERENIALTVSTPGAPVMVHGHATLLRHALSNLVVNAIQAVAKHDGERRVALALQAEGHTARVTVDDSGSGIDPKYAANLFVPFFTTKDVGEGMGLGLAISRGIVEAHGGTLLVESQAEGGVRATLTMPLNGASGNAEEAR